MTSTKLDNILGTQLKEVRYIDGWVERETRTLKLLERAIKAVAGDDARAATDDPLTALTILLDAERSKAPEAVIRDAIASTGWPRAMTPEEFAEASYPEPSWLLDGVLPSNGLNLLVSTPDGGKSTLTRAMAMAVMEGNSFLSRASRRGPVWYGGFEEDPARTRQHFVKMGWTKSLPLHPFLEFPPDEDPYQWIESEILRVKPSLVIIDTLSDILPFEGGPEKEAGYVEVRKKCRPLMRLARDQSVCILACHHTRKGDGRNWRDMVMGSNAYRSAVDTTLFIDLRDDDRRILKASQRYKHDGQNMLDTILELDPANERIISGGAVAVEKARELEQKAIDAVADHDGPMKRTDLTKTMGGNAEKARATLDSAARDGKLYSWKAGRAVYYELPKAGPGV